MTPNRSERRKQKDKEIMAVLHYFMIGNENIEIVKYCLFTVTTVFTYFNYQLKHNLQPRNQKKAKTWKISN